MYSRVMARKTPEKRFITLKVTRISGKPWCAVPERGRFAGLRQHENRLRYPEYRAPGSDKWQRIAGKKHSPVLRS